MTLRPLVRLLAGLALFSALVGAFATEKPSPAFSALTFEAACQQATAENKIVFIDFYTTWCEPCKMLDQTTWQDAAVIALLREKSIALKIDAEKEKSLARRYQLNAYPTLVLLKPDGTEIDRIVGYRESAKFIEEFTAGLAGQTAIQRARAAVTNAPNEHDRVRARYDLGKELARTGQSEAALVEYLWCYDEGMVPVASFTGVRLSYLLSSIADLARDCPPALAALEERRDQAQTLFLGGNSDRKVASELNALNRALKEDAKTLALYDQLPADDSRRKILGRALHLQLIAAQRYADALSAEPFTVMKKMWPGIMAIEQQPRPANQPAQFRQMDHEYCIRWIATRLEVLAGAGQLDDARELLATALAYDSSAEARTHYQEQLSRAGHADLLPQPEAVATKG